MSNYLDKIIYINLEYRTDRKAEIETELVKMDLMPIVERFEGIRVPEQGILGCTKSHLAVIKLAKERGYRNVLVLEDDFEFLVSKTEFENRLTEFFESSLGKTYDVCMITVNLYKTANEAESECPMMKRVLSSGSAAGYIVNQHYYDTLIKCWEDAWPLLETTKRHWEYANDVAWIKLQEKDNWYHFIERLGKQRSGFSDNANRIMDYN